MKPMNDRTRSEQPRSAETPPKRRFRLEKLEERIAPRYGAVNGHYNPQSKLVGRSYFGE